MTPSDWNPWPPPPNASGHIDAIDADGTVTQPMLFHYTARGSVWGYCVERYATHGRQTEAHPDYCGWRWHGTTPTPEAQGGAIMVWPWWEAPGELRALSDNGGDEDWVALLPASLADSWIGWMQTGTSFGVCSVSEYVLPDGRIVRIGAHA